MADDEAEPASPDSDYDELPIPHIYMRADGVASLSGADIADAVGEWFVS
jgi:hypothetical protein